MIKLKPSARVSSRYFLLKANKKDVEKVILDFIGILGWAEANPRFVRSKLKGTILAVNRKSVDKIRAAFAVSSDKIEVLRVSGTLKGLGKK